MFRVQFLVDDKRLGDVLRLISGKVLELEQHPVNNVKVKNGRAEAVHAVGSVRDALIPEMLLDPKVKKTRRFTTDFFGATIEKLGGSLRSQSTNLSVLLQRKQIKRVGRGLYQILGGK